jgi:hypothetical protein
MRTRSKAKAAALTLVSLTDDAFLLVIAACGDEELEHWTVSEDDGVPLFEAVKGLGCLSKGMRQQLYRLQPLVCVRSLAVVQRSNHGPWRVTLMYRGELTEAVVEQARQGRVRSINTSDRNTPLATAVARRTIPDLLGEGCSLLELDVSYSQLLGSTEQLYNTWAATFGEAAVCSAVLRTLRLQRSNLLCPLPELRLPALQVLELTQNRLTGGLGPLRRCTSLQCLQLSGNQLTGGLEPLRGCTALRILELSGNTFTGGLEPLRGCTKLQTLQVPYNHFTGGLEPLRGCKALELLYLESNHLTGSLEPLHGCVALQCLALSQNQITGSLEPLRGCTALAGLELESNKLTGDLEPLRGCAALQWLYCGDNQLTPTKADKAHFEKQCEDFFMHPVYPVPATY